MKQSITGYHTDEEGHWVAQLFCGHNQHVRHDPPWMVREWVTTASGRQNMLGHRLDCVKCDEDAPPDERPALVVSIQVGLPQTIGSEHSWTSSFIKQQVTEPIWLAAMNLAGDQQADLAHHGGPDKAVCVYPAIHYWHWRSQLKFPEMQWGAFGENFTVSELTEQDVCIGDVWSVGDALVQISQPRQPCWKLARRWSIKDLALQVQQTGFTGWYFRVLKEGLVQRDAVLQLVERSHEQWTIAAANQLMHHDKHDRMGVSRLASIPELSHSWRSTLTKRAETGQQPDESKRLGLNEK